MVHSPTRDNDRAPSAERVAPLVRRRILRCCARFGRDRRGSTAVEFAVVLVPFLGLFMAIMQTGLYFFTSEAVEVAVEDAARNIYTGAAQAAGIATADAFRQKYLCPASGPRKLPTYVDCSKLIIDVRSARSFTSANLSTDFYKSATLFCPGAPGVPGNLTIVRVVYPLPAIIPVLTGSANSPVGVLRTGLVNDVPNNGGWKQLILATAVFQNEPYDGSKYSMPAGCS